MFTFGITTRLNYGTIEHAQHGQNTPRRFVHCIRDERELVHQMMNSSKLVRLTATNATKGKTTHSLKYDNRIDNLHAHSLSVTWNARVCL